MSKIASMVKYTKRKLANGDMLQYFQDHPEKLREKRLRDSKKKHAMVAFSDELEKLALSARTVLSAKGARIAEQMGVPHQVHDLAEKLVLREHPGYNSWFLRRIPVGKAKHAAFAAELEKIAWGGKYYHGTSPSAEKSIASEGLKAARGGETMKDLSTTYLFRGDMKGKDIADKFVKDTKDRVTMSRSKILAKTYGVAKTEQETGSISAKMREARMKTIIPGDSKPRRFADRFLRKGKGLLVGAREAVKQLVEHQPLEIDGRGLHLTPDSGHRLLGVQHKGDVVPKLIRKAKASRFGKLFARAL
jgi:hypothetical protein